MASGNIIVSSVGGLGATTANITRPVVAVVPAGNTQVATNPAAIIATSLPVAQPPPPALASLPSPAINVTTLSVGGETAAVSSMAAAPGGTPAAVNRQLPPATAATAAGTPAPTAQAAVPAASSETKMVDKKRLQDLVKEVDPLEQLDDDVEEMLMQIADDFIDNVVTAACQIAKHRKANTVEVKDVQLYLERNWNMWVPGFGSDELKPFKKAATTEAHKQRMALIKKTLKKY